MTLTIARRVEPFRRTLFLAAGMIVALAFSLGGPVAAVYGQQAPSEADVRDAVSVQNSFRSVAKSVTPAVVNISSETVIRTENQFGEGDPFMDFFGQFYDIPREYMQRSLGTGFIISPDGYLISNFHVVRNATKIMVTLSDGSKYRAVTIGTDPKTDLAVLKIEGKNFPFVRLGDSDAVEVGDWAIAIGNPFGLSETFTVGVISAKGRKSVGLGEYENYLQTDAAINPGNSGGPLVNIRGEVMGINTAIASPSGGNVGIGFAIPVNMARGIAGQLKTSGKVVRGYIGVNIQDLTEEIARPLKLQPQSGVLVADVEKGGPAEKSGIQVGDVITEFSGKKVNSSESLQNEVTACPVGRACTLKVIRDGREQALEVRVAEMPSENATDRTLNAGVRKWLGLSFAEVTGALRKKYAIDDSETAGLIVIEADPAGSAAAAGLREGDLVLQINNTKLTDLDGLQDLIASEKSDASWLFLVRRQGRTFFIGVSPSP
jgi:serine protease Do